MKVQRTGAGGGGATGPLEYEWPWWTTLVALAVPALMLCLALLQGAGGSPGGWPRWLAAAIVLLPWAANLRSKPSIGPWVPSWVVAGVAWLPIVVLGHHYSASAAWFLLVYLVGQTATLGSLRVSATVYAASLATLLIEALTTQAPDSFSNWLGWFLGVTAAAVGGWIWRRQHALVTELSAAQEGLAERATLAERQRIAREVHDVLAHSLTVTLLHLTGARMAVRSDPEEAVEALLEAERVGRQSLEDVRRTVGLLAPAGGDATSPPLPGIDDLPGLVAGYADAGVAVHLDVDGDPEVVSAATGLCLYRIAQESLANASRHAPGSPVEVRLCISPDRAVLQVRNAGSASTDGNGNLGAGGRGIPGMRERVAAVGGLLSAGDDAGDWLVEAAVPLVRPAGSRWRPGCH